MQSTCEKCRTTYDDASSWRLCPHGPLEFGLDDYCPQCNTLESIQGPCKHQFAALKADVEQLKQQLAGLDYT